MLYSDLSSSIDEHCKGSSSSAIHSFSTLTGPSDTHSGSDRGTMDTEMTVIAPPAPASVSAFRTSLPPSSICALTGINKDSCAQAFDNGLGKNKENPSSPKDDILDSLHDIRDMSSATRPPLLTFDLLGITEPERAEENLAEATSEMDKVLIFFDGMRVETLKQVCELLSMKKTGNNKMLVQRIFVTMGHMGAGTEYPLDIAARELFYLFDCLPFDVWLHDNSQRMFWLKSPDVSNYL